MLSNMMKQHCQLAAWGKSLLLAFFLLAGAVALPAQGPSYAQNPYRPAAPRIEPGMKYSQLKHLYDYREYSARGGWEQYSPGVSGLISFFVPGAGQWLCGETGRGFAWFGATLASALLVSAGSAMTGVGLWVAMAGDSGLLVAGLTTAGIGMASWLIIDICSILDAVKVAKVKNMYYRDLRARGYSLKLHPSVEGFRMPGGALQFSPGLSLALNF